FAEAEHLDDVRVHEPGRDARLAHEHLHERRVGREVRQDPLHHQHARKSRRPGRARLPHLGHAALPQFLEELVLPERRGAHSRHWYDQYIITPKRMTDGFPEDLTEPSPHLEPSFGAVERFQLTVIDGPKSGVRWESKSDRCSIGSLASND